MRINATANTNNRRLPENVNRAKAYPAIADKVTAPNACPSDTTSELPNTSQNGTHLPSSNSVTFCQS